MALRIKTYTSFCPSLPLERPGRAGIAIAGFRTLNRRGRPARPRLTPLSIAGGVALRFWVLSALKIGVSPSVVVMVPSHCDGRHAKHSKSHSDDQQCPLHDQVLPLWVMGSPTGFKRKVEQKFPPLVPIGYTQSSREIETLFSSQ
jgi:hypothetical protein